jgi:type IV pilus assembly protein PilA
MYCKYRRLQTYLFSKKERKGFTLIELLVVSVILGIFVAISTPNLIKQIEKAREAEAIKNLGALNRAQQAYYFEKANFATDMTELGSDLTLSSRVYDYSIIAPITNTEVHHLATPRPTYAHDIKTFTSAVYRVPNSFISVNCKGNAAGDTPSIVATNTCNNGNFVN